MVCYIACLLLLLPNQLAKRYVQDQGEDHPTHQTASQSDDSFALPSLCPLIPMLSHPYAFSFLCPFIPMPSHPYALSSLYPLIPMSCASCLVRQGLAKDPLHGGHDARDEVRRRAHDGPVDAAHDGGQRAAHESICFGTERVLVVHEHA